MPQPSRAPALFAGLIAGLAIDSIQYLLDSFVFSDNWSAVATFLNNAAQHSPVVSISSTLILILLQLAGFTAGVLALRFYSTALKSQKPSAWKPAALAWTLTYGLVCIALLIMSAKTKEPNKAPMVLWQGLAFAFSSWLGCWAGTSFGGWVYREIAILANPTGAET
jgi:hypothetical protein